MKVYVPSHNRPDTIKTSKYLEASGIDYRVLLHDTEQEAAYLKAGIVPKGKIIVTNAAPGITNQRNFIRSELVEPGEYYISLDDNISGFTRVVDEYYDLPKLPVDSSAIKQSEYRQPVTAYLIQKYPGLFKLKDKKTGVKEAELAIRFTSHAQVSAWRGQMIASGRSRK
jgi:hypothetical protein